MKTKNRFSVWFCCSTIKIKGINKKKPSDAPRTAACFCCSVIEQGSPPPSPREAKTADQGPFDLSTKKGSLTVVVVPAKDGKKPNA